MARERVVVCGKPGSGKTTYARRMAERGDIIWDADEIVKALNCSPTFPYPADISQLVMAWRRMLLESIVMKQRRLFVIITDKESARKVARKIGGVVVDAEEVRQRFDEFGNQRR